VCLCAGERTAMPFCLSELAQMSVTLRDVCLGIIDITHPDTRPVSQLSRLVAVQQLRLLAYVFRVCLSVCRFNTQPLQDSNLICVAPFSGVLFCYLFYRCCWLLVDDQLLGHHTLKPLAGPVLKCSTQKYTASGPQL